MQSMKASCVSSSVGEMNETRTSLLRKVSCYSKPVHSVSSDDSKEQGFVFSPDVSGGSGETRNKDDNSVFVDDTVVTMRHVSSLGQTVNVDDGRNPTALSLDLQNVFPEALRHVVPDEAAAEAILTDNSAAAAGGYHRQFSEMALREVHSVLLRASSTLETRRRYLLHHHAPELDEDPSRASGTLMLEEAQRDLNEWDEEWFQPLSLYAAPLRTVTLQAPRFVAGMLWNADDRFLLGGTALTEEARVLQVRPDNNSSNLTLSVGSASFTELSDKKAPVRLLLREYTSVSRAGMGCMVQTFSLIQENYSLVIPRTQTLPHEYIKDVMERCIPGSITRAFSLALLIPPLMRHTALSSSLFKNSLDAHCTSVSPEDEKITLQNVCFTTAVDLSSSQSPNTQSAPLQKRGAWRQPLGDEVYLRFSKPKLYAWALQHQPAVLTAHTNVIRDYLFYSQRLHFRRLMRKLLRAVRTIQRFFRRLLKRKRRAVSRMLAQWTQLELQCRERLKTSIPPPTVDDRLDFVVGSVLWEHILTTKEFRMNMLNELFAERRQAYHKWCAQRVEEEEEQLQQEETMCFSHVKPESISGDSEVKDLLSKDFRVFHNLRENKWRDVVHERFGWFIDPEELLQESQRRLLLSLRSSILTMSDVRAEMGKMERKVT